MAEYTLELFEVIELADGDIGLNTYPIWDEAYREKLNSKIVNHYHNREIGVETVSMFRFAMSRRMAEVMPYYNDLYKTTQLQFDPLSTVDLRTISTGTSEAVSETESDSETSTKSGGTSRAVNSNLPQVQLSGRGDYATSAADTNSSTEGEGTSKENASATTRDERDSETHMSGYQGVASELVQRYRDTLLNIDLMVINELSDLFMMIWGNSDNYTPYPFTPLGNN